MFKRFLSRYPRLFLRLRLWRKVGLQLTLINWIFQRLLRRHARLKCAVHFTSAISEANIEFQADLTTLASFAASGGCYFQAVNGIKLGRNFLFAPGVKLISANHAFDLYRKAVTAPPIIIGNDVWLGANVIVLPGIILGNNTIVGAGSVVTKSFPQGNVVIAGNPAKVIRTLHD